MFLITILFLIIFYFFKVYLNWMLDFLVNYIFYSFLFFGCFVSIFGEFLFCVFLLTYFLLVVSFVIFSWIIYNNVCFSWNLELIKYFLVFLSFLFCFILLLIPSLLVF